MKHTLINLQRKRLSRPQAGRRWLSLAALLILTGMLLAACSSAPSQDLEVGDQAPEFSLTATSGETVSLSDYVGKQPVLLYFHMAVG
jgi:hypothetical protein